MDTSLQRLEFGKILQRVQNLCESDSGRQLASELRPAVKRSESQRLRDETLHAVQFIKLSVLPSLSSLDNLAEALTKMSKGSVYLDPLLLRGAGNAFIDAGKFARAAGELADDVPGALHRIASEIPDLEETGREFLRITTPSGELSPDASPLLKKISRRIDSLRSSLASRLSSITARFAGKGILRDAPPTMRAGRFVLPVASSGKKSVRGIVHDRSDSGATFFIEPSELVEAGNELQEAVMDMEQERRRILRDATLKLRDKLEEAASTAAILSSLDLVFARGRYMIQHSTAFPEEGKLHLRSIVHPLLPVETAVRSDVFLDDTWRVLVISGPNAGGKSVLLGAIALASVCSRSGLGAHVKNPSTMPFFSAIMVSMGDNQSIDMHLSTYSARLSEQKTILETGNSETLAIVDEPAAGTDPVTGAALAAVFLERIADSGVRTIVSTHMGQLKLLAMEKQGFLNGSMSFNPETLAPGYSFIPHIPGASCTLEAAAIAGFPRDILDEASQLAGDSFRLDILVSSLRELEETRREELEKISESGAQAEAKRQALEEQLTREREKLRELTVSAVSEKEKQLREIRSRADSLMVSMASSRNREQLLENRRKLAELTAEANTETADNQHSDVKSDTSSHSTYELKPGDTVIVKGWPDTGRVEKVGRSTAMVRLGLMLIKENLANLTRVDEPDPEVRAISEFTPIQEKPEAILLGMTVDEAVVELDIKLDNCTALGLKRLRVVHGKGRLMKGVTDWLKRDRRVKTVSIAPREEGGTGASIVILKG